MKILTDPSHESLLSRATAWDKIVEALNPDDPKTVDAQSVIDQINAAAEAQANHETLQQRDQTITELNRVINEQKAKIQNLEKRPGAPPAPAFTESDPPPASGKKDIGCLSGTESFIDSLDKVQSWL